MTTSNSPELPPSLTIVSSLLSPPILSIVNDSAPLDSPRRFGGYCRELADEIAARLGYDDYRLVDGFVTSGEVTYGRRLPNGTWTGLITKVINGDGDFVLADLSINSDRLEVIDYSFNILEPASSGRALLRAASVRTDLFRFLGPFHWSLWLTFILVICLMCVVCWIFMRLDSTLSSQGQHTALDDQPPTLSNCTWSVLSIVFGYGPIVNFRATSIRVVVLSFYCAVWWLMSSYTANLAAFLTIDRMDTSIHHVWDIPYQNKVPVVVISKGYSQQIIGSSTREDGLLNELQKMLSSDQFIQIQMDQMTEFFKSRSNFVFISDALRIVRVVNEIEGSVMLPGSVYTDRFAIGVRKGNSVLLKAINKILIELSEEEFIDALDDRYFSTLRGQQVDAARASGEAQSSAVADALSLSNIGGVFIVIACAIPIGLILLALEHLAQRRSQRHSQIDTSTTSLSSQSSLKPCTGQRKEADSAQGGVESEGDQGLGTRSNSATSEVIFRRLERETQLLEEIE